MDPSTRRHMQIEIAANAPAKVETASRTYFPDLSPNGNAFGLQLDADLVAKLVFQRYLVLLGRLELMFM
ncbi:hypothetical protein Mp_2g23320 [Marchantia polymorpha subsp. ruderalis]|uniref:Uncharacterized protein n=1 Tax=Marchantia polymorpha TaxID=3197 RepID=A0A2R6VYJ3_MARPO|nr:hypothetical protein MARPO_0632s0002 [Marchantia polymorpha]BBN03416.1 hypothetical protein Mp_2g23320 [Marchantia polymorpha subsp. ruderalis]|eukprot:PTQ26675.1 hypothetical protein MARPO_0632s0002 [Marchantia polymorpha]